MGSFKALAWALLLLFIIIYVTGLGTPFGAHKDLCNVHWNWVMVLTVKYSPSIYACTCRTDRYLTL